MENTFRRPEVVAPPRRRALTRLAAASAAGLVAAATVVAVGTPTQAITVGCTPWAKRTLLSGHGQLENLMLDGKGGLYLTDNSGGRLLRATPDGKVAVLATGLEGASGLASKGDGYVYLSTGNTPLANLFGPSSGTVVKYDPATGRRTTWASGLRVPNGIAFLPDGSLVATRALNVFGAQSGVTRTTGGSKGHDFSWIQTTSSNGGHVDASGTWYYFNNTLASEVWRARTTHPNQRQKLATLPLLTANDDLAPSRDGKKVYVAGYNGNTVTQVDVATGATCVIASGLSNPTSVRFGDGSGFAADRLYVTSFGNNGELVELTPPA